MARQELILRRDTTTFLSKSQRLLTAIPILLVFCFLFSTPAVLAASIDAGASFNLSNIYYLGGGLLPGSITGVYGYANSTTGNSYGNFDEHHTNSQPSDAAKFAILREYFNLPPEMTDEEISHSAYESQLYQQGTNYELEYSNRPWLWESSFEAISDSAVDIVSGYGGAGYDSNMTTYGNTIWNSSAGLGATVSGKSDIYFQGFSGVGQAGIALYFQFEYLNNETILEIPYTLWMEATGLDVNTAAQAASLATVGLSNIEGNIGVSIYGSDQAYLQLDSLMGTDPNSLDKDSFMIAIKPLSNSNGGGSFALWLDSNVNAAASINATPVPVPGTMLLLGSCILGLAAFRKRI